jgi:hypothetical protein
MHPLLFKILILIPLLALLGILIYKKINESFDGAPTDETQPATTPPATTIPATTIPAALISTQLTTGIAGLLGVSVRRITNLDYSGDVSTQTLAVSFTVLDSNLLESGKGELSAATVANNANNLFAQGNFVVPINGMNVRLTKTGTSGGGIGGTSIPTQDPASYFNNKGLLDSASYARQVYDTVPVDSAATRFFTLQPDKNFNLAPVLSSK